eukprot:2486-Heterococcus_DN1.PRE.1
MKNAHQVGTVLIHSANTVCTYFNSRDREPFANGQVDNYYSTYAYCSTTLLGINTARLATTASADTAAAQHCVTRGAQRCTAARSSCKVYVFDIAVTQHNSCINNSATVVLCVTVCPHNNTVASLVRH